MVTVTRPVACAALVWLCGCSTAPPTDAPIEPEELWGDEYEGIADDADLEDARLPSRRSGGAIDVLLDPAPEEGERALASAGASIRSEHSGARYRENRGGRAGAIEVFDEGPLQHLAIGFVRPSVGEGAILADARELGTPSARTLSSTGVVRVSPSSSRWGSVLGAGATLSRARASLSIAAWRPHDDDTTVTVWSGVEYRFARTRVGAAAGRTPRQPSRDAASLTVVQVFQSAVVCAETGVVGRSLAYSVRAAAGEVWYAAFFGGASANIAPRADRRAALVERRDSLGPVATRAIASTVIRRDASEEDRQRRVELRLQALVDDHARVEAGIRFVERVTAELPSPLTLGNDERRHEWRARVSLRTAEHPSSTTHVEHQFRIDAVRARSSLGLTGTWRGKIRHGPLDAAVEASAWGLETDQVVLLTSGGLPGSGLFTTVSGGGSRLKFLLRGRLGAHASVAAEWGRSAAGNEEVRVGASFRW